MCDYSLHAVASRPAKVGEKLVTSSFSGTTSRGLASESEPAVAVCLLPGTELAFEDTVAYDKRLFWAKRTEFAVGKFIKINSDRETYHDAIEFPDGKILLLQRLCLRQRVTVLQFPVVGKPPAKELPEGNLGIAREARHVPARQRT